MLKENEPKNKGGRPRVPFDWVKLEALCQFKVSKVFCADYLGVSEQTIENRLREKYDMTFTEYSQLKISRTGFKLQQKAIEMALKGNTTMMIFALKNLANWSDNVDIEKNKGDTIKVVIKKEDESL